MKNRGEFVKLIIAEKPSVAKTIAKVIGNSRNHNGYILCGDYIVTWCVGHLVSLAVPEDYSESWKKWDLKTLPMIPDQWKFNIIQATKSQFNVVKELLNQKEIDEVICATDAGREGELIFRLVYAKVNCSKPIKRLWVSSLEDQAIKEGLDNLRDGSEFESLYQSALARAKADWLVGMNYTRLYTVGYSEKLTIGRVQTPTVAMVVERDNAIKNFVKSKYYEIEVQASKNNQRIIFNSTNQWEKKEDVPSDLGRQIVVTSYTEDKKRLSAPLLHDLTSLQKTANQVYGFTAQQTLDYAQSLYEKKLITYPRTDSRYLNESMQNLTEELIHLCPLYEIDHIKCDRLFDDSKVSDHHALLPTQESLKEDLHNVPSSEIKIYELIYYRLLESVSGEHVIRQQKVEAMVQGLPKVKLQAVGKIVEEEGFKSVEKVYREVNLKDSPVLKLEENEALIIDDVSIVEKTKNPPKPYNESTLLGAMETAGTEDLDSSLDIERKGLGTAATRASIIEKLIQSEYLVRDKKNLRSTEKAQRLITVVDDRLKDPKTTAQWENLLSLISTGDYQAEDFLKKIIEEISNHCSNFKPDSNLIQRPQIGTCPICGNAVIKTKKVYFCTNKECNFHVFTEMCGKSINEAEAIDLMENGETKLIKGFVSKKGNQFNAKLKFKPDYSVEFVFEKKGKKRS